MAETRKQDGEQDTAASYFSHLLDLPKSRYWDVKLHIYHTEVSNHSSTEAAFKAITRSIQTYYFQKTIFYIKFSKFLFKIRSEWYS